jgi:hypothetical protein
VTKESNSDSGRRPPLLGVVRLTWAGLLLAVPGKVLRALGGPGTGSPVTIARILGVRHAAQGLVEMTAWPRWRRTGGMVDAAHGLTAAGLALRSPQWRRIGLADTFIAGAFASAGLLRRRRR